MDLFRPVDFGTTYFFSFLAETNAPLFLYFWTGCLLSSRLMAALIVFMTASLLADRGHYRTVLLLLAGFLLSHLLIEVISILVRRPLSTFALRWLEMEPFLQGHWRNLQSTFPGDSIFLSTFAWMSLYIAGKKLNWNRFATLAILLLGFTVVFGGFLCNMCLARHYLSDLLAGLAGGAGMALLAWSRDRLTTPSEAAP